MKKKIILSLTAVLLVLLAALGVWQYRRAARFGEAVFPEAATVTSESPALGEAVTFSVDYLIPWGQQEAECVWTPEKSSTVVVRQSENRLTGIRWNGKRYRWSQVICPIRTGEIPLGAAQFSIKRPSFADGEHIFESKVELPALTVRPLEVAPGSEIPIAGAITPVAKTISKWWWIAGGALLVLIAGAILWIVKKRSQKMTAIALPPWEIARGELAALRQAADTGDRPLPWCVARLTDVVRDYLSARFAWQVRQQTTGEFLNSLRRDKASPLSADQMRSLGDFMNAADLVKFAKMEPDTGYFHDAMHHAETLIDETRIREPEPEQEAKK